MTFKYKIEIHLGCLMFIAFAIGSCNKLVQINPPANSITTAEVFADSSDASAAIMGIYAMFINTQGSFRFGDGAVSIYTGLSSDELNGFYLNSNLVPFYRNTLIAQSSSLSSFFWDPAYQLIYQTNACISGLEASTGISQATKNQLIGEAKFLRAFCYFYLVNLFGDVPYVTSIAYAQTALASRTPTSQIYPQIIADLKDAQSLLLNDYSISGGQRTRANRWAATALLSRVYLYTGDWADAAAQATAIINNSGTFSLDTLNGVFLANSNEAILQWQLNTNNTPGNATPDGYNIIPYSSTSFPFYYLSNQLLGAFEPGDQRQVAWLDSTVYSGTTYYYPYKYKIGTPTYQYDVPATEYYMVLRLAEQFLTRAEAEANGANGGTVAAVADLNVIRTRAGLDTLSTSLGETQVLAAVAQERRIEFFAEWGHRWLDLKRTGQIDSVMAVVTPQKVGGGVWNSYQQLYPIPYSEITVDPNLKQNPGYN